MKKKDIILRVWGGVGNQLFIYAFAKVLSLITDCKVTLDIRTGFANDGYKRVYRLGDFSISLLPALRFYTLLSFAQRKMPYIRHLLAYKFDFFEEDQKYPLETLDSFFKIYSDKNLYLQGYWQYFDFSSYRDVLLKDLRFDVEINNTYLYYSDLIEKVNYYIEHPEKAQEIIGHANEYVRQFQDKKRERMISLLVLDKYFRLTNAGYITKGWR